MARTYPVRWVKAGDQVSWFHYIAWIPAVVVRVSETGRVVVRRRDNGDERKYTTTEIKLKPR